MKRLLRNFLEGIKKINAWLYSNNHSWFVRCPLLLICRGNSFVNCIIYQPYQPISLLFLPCFFPTPMAAKAGTSVLSKSVREYSTRTGRLTPCTSLLINRLLRVLGVICSASSLTEKHGRKQVILTIVILLSCTSGATYAIELLFFTFNFCVLIWL